MSTADPPGGVDDGGGTIVLRDGSTVRVRSVGPGDSPRLETFLASLSPDSREFRFHSAGARPERMASMMVEMGGDRQGLVVTTGVAGGIIAHGMYVRSGPARAEVAVEVADEHRGRGLGTLLLGQLAEIAQARGIELFEAVVLPDNHPMLETFRESGFPLQVRSAPGEIHVEFPTDLSAGPLARFEHRDQVAAATAVRALLSPRSVAVVGASRRRGGIAAETFHNLLSSSFNGPVYPVNPSAPVVQSVTAYPTMESIPGLVDLAVIVVPGPEVVDVARQCAAKGVRGLVVVSAGFAESGPEGEHQQAELVEVCRQSGMRLIGPNCMGILNTDPEVRLNATFAPEFPPPGGVGFMSQSGGLGLAAIDQARSLGLGLSSFVSVGNKADLSGNDFLQYWETDPSTHVILLYLESFGNARKFARIARRVARSKPIVAVKSGRSAAGARATSSHTGGLLATSDVTVDALFRQAGVIRTDTLGEMFEVTALLSSQPVPVGNRVAILTNAGGPGVLCADAAEAGGLVVPSLPEGIRAELAAFLPAAASVGNPIDMLAAASAADFARAVRLLAACDEVDAIVVIFTPPLVTRAADVAVALREAGASLSRSVPLLAVFMADWEVAGDLAQAGIPTYRLPEDAARALAHAARYGSWLREPEGMVVQPSGLMVDRASAVIAEGLAGGVGWQPPEVVFELLSCYGLPVAASRTVASPDQAATAAVQIGGKVVIKAIAPGLLHRTDAGAVRLGVEATAAEGVARDLEERLSEAGYRLQGFLVQAMAEPGVEMLVGMVQDRSFGPVLACGAGGTNVELLKDVSVRITPITDREAMAMVRSLATFPLLDGYRGAPQADVAALEDILLRVAALVEAHPEVVEMDINPVLVHPQGATVVDARIRLEVPSGWRSRLTR